jgi:hypothetical protein
MQISGLFELVNGGVAVLVELLGQLADGTPIIKGSERFILGQLCGSGHGARRQLIEQIHLLDEALDVVRVGIKAFARGVLFLVRGGKALARVLAKGRERVQQCGAVARIGFAGLAQFGQCFGEGLGFLRVELSEGLNGLGDGSEIGVEG